MDGNEENHKFTIAIAEINYFKDDHSTNPNLDSNFELQVDEIIVKEQRKRFLVDKKIGEIFG